MIGAFRRSTSTTLLLAALVSCGALSQTSAPNNDFQQFFSRFRAAVRANDAKELANLINFPFYVHAAAHSRAEFERDKDESVNIFARDIRRAVLDSTDRDIIAYRNRDELDEDKPDFTLIPRDSPLVELDIINPRGGPALRLMFSRAAGGYRLFCVTQ